jgi:precorrin-6B methylase 2
MSFEQVMGTVQGMLAGTDALAAIGAELSLKTSGQDADPAIESALGAVWAAAGLPELDSLAPPQQAMVLGLIRLYFAQADDLLSDPARPPGWTFTDPLVLDGMGRGSMLIPHLLAGIPELESVTSFLDVGAGVGLLAVSAAGVWPAATIVGVDVWEPALERARENVRAAGLEDRITLREQDLVKLDDVDVYDCAWLPTFFLAETVLTTALANVVHAVVPGGWIVLGIFSAPPDPLARATTTLRTIRSGGTDLDVTRATQLLGAAGCTSVRSVAPQGPAPIVFVIGQKPAPPT